MFVVELIASSFLDLISKQARAVCRRKRVLVPYFYPSSFPETFQAGFRIRFGVYSGPRGFAARCLGLYQMCQPSPDTEASHRKPDFE